MRRFGWGLVIAVLAVGVVTPPASAVTSQEAKARNKIYALVNNYRVAEGENALTPNAVIEDLAYAHSRKMARAGRISHNGSTDRFNTIEATIVGSTARCENVAMVGGYDSARIVARKIVALWKKSPPHNDCLLDNFGNADIVGVGVKKRGTSWWATFITADA